jgi:hypothetical protein
MQRLTLITPTSDRPAAFHLCERWMRRALDRLCGLSVEWIVVDDGRSPAVCTLGQRHVRRAPSPDPALSFRGNLVAALERAHGEKVLFIEDDDWYAPNYLRQMCAWLDGEAVIAGEARAKYYNVATRRYQQCLNCTHASLCQTGMRAELTPWLLDRLQHTETTFVDLELWHIGAAECPRHLWPSSLHCVGIKGLPGKQGIGIGHRLDDSSGHDPGGHILRRWIGEDAADYTEFRAHA